MMLDKITIIGDIHGNDIWKTIVEKEKDSSRIIFLGDYFDSYIYVNAEKEFNNFNEIIKFKESNDNVTLLFGNHDLHYLIDNQYTRYSEDLAKILKPAYLKNLIDANVLQVCTTLPFKDIFISHAGLSNTWLRNNRLLLCEHEINNLLKINPNKFDFVYKSTSISTGDNIYQSPMWIRPFSLKLDSPYGITQIVGHTMDESASLRNKILFCDSLLENKYFTLEHDTYNTVLNKIII